VREALNVNIFKNLNRIIESLEPKEKFKQISAEDNVKDDPYFIYCQLGDNDSTSLLLAIEVKTSWVLKLDVEESLHETYEDDFKRKHSKTILDDGKKTCVINILHQIFGYLVVNNLQYGIFTTYNQTWFLK